jgi:hypothetical protein
VKQGVLADALTYESADIVGDPQDHQIYFVGEQPHHLNGQPIALGGGACGAEILPGLTAHLRFSSKPKDPVTGEWRPYSGLYEKFKTYALMIGGPALVLDPSFELRPMADPIATDDLPLVYRDALSRRGDIEQLSNLLRQQRVAIIGAGGTGSYVLDFLSKTRVEELRLIDDDYFYLHNLYRCPGPTDRSEFRERKVDVLKARYDLIHKHVSAHPMKLQASTAGLLDDVTFAFICVDKGSSRAAISQILQERGIPFIDVGAGLRLSNAGLAGMARSTHSFEQTAGYIQRSKSLPSMDDENDVYDRNVQIVELNALNAALAVVMFKKTLGFYRDDVRDFQLVYVLERSSLYKQTLDGIA